MNTKKLKPHYNAQPNVPADFAGSAALHPAKPLSFTLPGGSTSIKKSDNVEISGLNKNSYKKQKPLIMKFEWDTSKEEFNIKQHGITFEQASYVFSDPFALSRYDDEHSEDEGRWILLGKQYKYSYEKSQEVAKAVLSCAE